MVDFSYLVVRRHLFYSSSDKYMVFSSLLFVFLFLPITLTGFFLLDKKFRYIYLLLANLAFYSWGERDYVILLLVFIFSNYIFGLIIQSFKNKSFDKNARICLVISIVFNISVLAYYKYSYFILTNLLSALSFFNIHFNYIPQTTHLPIGVSFFTFQAISYLVDIYRSDVKATKSLFNFALYKSFFPQLIAGPIVRYKDVHEQFEQKKSVVPDDFVCGIQRFVIGLGKKVIIANTLAEVASDIFNLPTNEISLGVAWLGAVCYTAQIYFDFSGYSDMAIGMARMFGFKFLENFNYPYTARSIQDFWRRWHISLSSWFRDYLYIPLGGNRKGKYRTYLNSFIVFTLCGFWHGAAWTFIIWGAWHGFFLILERSNFGKFIKKLPGVFGHIYTLLVVIIGWVVFRSDTMVEALSYLKAMAGINATHDSIYKAGDFMNLEVITTLIIAVIAAIPFTQLFRLRSRRNKVLPRYYWFVQALKIVGYGCFLIMILTISAMYLASGTYNPFIYYRF